MEYVEVQLSEFTLRSRSLALSHLSTRLGRGLDRGETLVVRDPGTGHSYAAVVADVDFELEDTVYRIEIGTRLAPDEAADWLAPDTADAGDLTTRHIMNLLGELRRSRHALRALVDDVAR